MTEPFTIFANSQLDNFILDDRNYYTLQCKHSPTNSDATLFGKEKAILHLTNVLLNVPM